MMPSSPADETPTLPTWRMNYSAWTGCDADQTDVAALLLREPLDAGRRGLTGRSAIADAASRRAANASKLAEDSDGDLDAHEDAAQLHRDAASHHAAVAAYHRLQTKYHQSKATATAVTEPEPESTVDEESGRGHYAEIPISSSNAPDFAAGDCHCSNCDGDFDEADATPDADDENRFTCPKCGASLNKSLAKKENAESERQAMGAKRLVQPADAPLCCARSLPHLLADATLPASILYMPSGTHRITPSQGGKPVTVVVRVDESSAARLEQQRQILAASGNKPFFSVQHNTQIAAYWPSRIYWAVKPDPTGKMVEGIWADGEWTAAGREAVEGKNFRSFSPTFFVNGISNDEDNPAEVMCNESAPLNMGALENDPAFGGAMSPLWPDNQSQARP